MENVIPIDSYPLLLGIFAAAIIALVSFIIALLRKIDKINEKRLEDNTKMTALMTKATEMVDKLFTNPTNAEILERLRDFKDEISEKLKELRSEAMEIHRNKNV